MRGLEEFFIDAWLDYNGSLANKIGGISPRNTKLKDYKAAPEAFLKKCGTPK